MGYIPIKDKLEEIERRGRQIRRRQEKLKDDAAFLADMLLTRATSDMEAQRRLLREWEAVSYTHLTLPTSDLV